MKNYDEIANRIFERRDQYVASKERKKQMVISIVASLTCFLGVLAIGFGLWKGGVLSNVFPVLNGSPNVSDHSNKDFEADNNQNSTTHSGYASHNSTSSSTIFNTTTFNNSTSSNPDEKDPSEPSKSTSSKSTTKSSHSSQNNTSFYGSNTTNFDEDDYSEPSEDTSSNGTPSNPSVMETDYFIDSIDKINFYSAKKIISEKSLLPFGVSAHAFSAPKILLLNNTYAEYPIDRYKVFTATMVTYFTMELNDERGFLAQKLGGTGFVEVVVTENNMEDMGQMITFKRDDTYYTCFMNGQENDPNSDKVSRTFSSHKYIEGFNIVKNLEQENYQFTVHYEQDKVVGFECAPFKSIPSKYVVDDITFIEDFCIVIYAKQTFTIEELEIYSKNENEEDSL